VPHLPIPYPGFHPLPPRTVREVFPHTALRQPSSGSFRGYATHIPALKKYFSVLLPRPATTHRAGICGHRARGIADSCSSWPLGIACAGVLVICLWVLLALFGHAPSLTSPPSPVEVEALPSHRVMLSRWSSVLWPPPTSHPAFPWISLLQLIPAITMGVGHRPNETSPVPSSTFTTSRSPYAGEACPELVEGFFGAAFPGSSRLPWPSLSLTSSALPGSPSGANLSTLQDSLDVAGCGFALPSQEVTTLQHLRSPRSTGCLLRGLLAVTAVGLSPTSRRQLSGHTMRGLARFTLYETSSLNPKQANLVTAQPPPRGALKRPADTTKPVKTGWEATF